MKIIGVLQAMRKEKRAQAQVLAPRNSLLGFLGVVLAVAFLASFFVHNAVAQPEDRRMGTRSGQSEISRDPATGDRTIATPDPKPQDRDQGPRTVIVTPEVFPDRQPVRPSGPSHGVRPR